MDRNYCLNVTCNMHIALESGVTTTDPKLKSVEQLKTLDLQQAFEKTADRALLSRLCDDSDLHRYVFK